MNRLCKLLIFVVCVCVCVRVCVCVCVCAVNGYKVTNAC